MYIEGFIEGLSEEALDMKVTKAQAQANRAHIVETASQLFRERGYDGVGIADLMATAGFTHGGFYKHFASKADLLSEAATCGFAQGAATVDGIGAAAFVTHYLSRKHRDALSNGCTMAALSGDAARQPASTKTAFAAGLERMLETLAKQPGAPDDEDEGSRRARRIEMIAQAVGALILSRACPDDSPLADEILDVCREAVLAKLPPRPHA